MSNMTENLDQQQLLQLLALQNGAGQTESWYDAESDDWDDDDEDDVEYYDDDDDDEGAFFDSDYDDDDDDDDDDSFEMLGDFAEGRRRRRRRTKYRKHRSRRLRKMKGSKSTVLKSASGQQMRVQFGQSFAKAKDVNKLIADTEAKFKTALKERKDNFDRLSKQISGVSGSVDKVSKRVKKLESSAQTSQLMSLMSSPPKIESLTFEEGDSGKVKSISYEKQDNMLPLLLSGALGDMGDGDNTALLLLAMNR